MTPYPPDTQAIAKRKLRHIVRRYLVLVALAVLALAWVLGYSKGMLDGYQQGRASIERKAK